MFLGGSFCKLNMVRSGVGYADNVPLPERGGSKG
jgi:hypothetical protein